MNVVNTIGIAALVAGSMALSGYALAEEKVDCSKDVNRIVELTEIKGLLNAQLRIEHEWSDEYFSCVSEGIYDAKKDQFGITKHTEDGITNYSLFKLVKE